MKSHLSNIPEREVILTNGTRGIVRPIVPGDMWALAEALEDLADESRERRFLFNKTNLSEKELKRLSNPDGMNHIAYGRAVKTEGNEELLPIAVARCFRDTEDGELAELAIVIADPWQGMGVGSELMRTISSAAFKVGIRRWFAAMFSDNFAMRRLFEKFGRKCEEHEIGSGIVEVIYEITVPAD